MFSSSINDDRTQPYEASWRREDRRERIVSHEDFFTSPCLEEENESLAGARREGLRNGRNLSSREHHPTKETLTGAASENGGTRGLAPHGNGIVSTRKVRQ